jgi:hypothetical protein
MERDSRGEEGTTQDWKRDGETCARGSGEMRESADERIQFKVGLMPVYATLLVGYPSRLFSTHW